MEDFPNLTALIQKFSGPRRKRRSGRDVWIRDLIKAYAAQKQFLKVAPQLFSLPLTNGLRESFAEHAQNTAGHVRCLEAVLEHLNEGNRPGDDVLKDLCQESRQFVNESLLWLCYCKICQANPDQERAVSPSAKAAGFADWIDHDSNPAPRLKVIEG
jgi:hypothetical protein